MTARGCDVDGGARPQDARGLCELHYKRLMRRGQVGPRDRLNTPQTGPCTVAGRDRSAVARGLCRGDYQRV